MTVTDQIKILNRKIKQNESQYDLDREAAKISALSSNNLDKYELLTGEDLNLKPSTVEQAKFECSPLGRIFNKGLNKDEDKKEGILKRLKNIEDKNEKLLEVKNNTEENIKEVADFVDQPLSFEAKELDDSTQKNETIRCKTLFKYIAKVMEKADVYIRKSVTVLVRLPNTRKKSYLKTLIDACTEALKRRKHCKILRFATKEKQLLSNLTKLCRRSSMI